MAAVTTSEACAVAQFRAELRQFLRRTERIARKSDLTPQRYHPAPDGERRSRRERAIDRHQSSPSGCSSHRAR